MLGAATCRWCTNLPGAVGAHAHVVEVAVDGGAHSLAVGRHQQHAVALRLAVELLALYEAALRLRECKSRKALSSSKCLIQSFIQSMQSMSAQTGRTWRQRKRVGGVKAGVGRGEGVGEWRRRREGLLLPVDGAAAAVHRLNGRVVSLHAVVDVEADVVAALRQHRAPGVRCNGIGLDRSPIRAVRGAC